MGEKILIGAITCAVTLLITHIFNTILNAPKKRKAELTEILKQIQGLRDDVQSKDTRTHEDLKFVKEGLQAVLKNELKVRYFKWLELGFAPEDAKEDLERMYIAYHNLGANGVMDRLRERFLNLPEERD